MEIDEVPPQAFEPEFRIAAPSEAVCQIKVGSHGTKNLENDYLPHVLACEAPGGAGPEMLRAQAIAARSYAYFHALSFGSICNGQGCQVYGCGKTPTAAHKQAVADTSGMILRYNDNLTIGFYVAGDKTPNADCHGNSSGVGGTEKYVTYNEGKSGTDITQTKIAWRHDPSDGDYGQNRGALSQWGAHCLAEKHDYTATEILQYYYGDDIELVQVDGACIGDTDLEPVGGCEPVAPDEETILDNDSRCLRLLGPSKYWRTESAGLGGSLRWTKSTQGGEFNVAQWNIDVTEPGQYRLEVHIDPDHTTGTDALYEVVDAVEAREVRVDQTVGDWIELGVFTFEPDAEDQQVRMTDAIGIKGEVLQVDALRVVPTDVECGDDGCKTDAIGMPPGGVVDGSRGGEELACAVGSRPRPSAWLAGLFVLGLGLRRRR